MEMMMSDLLRDVAAFASLALFMAGFSVFLTAL
jgi:hypothetical protein